MLDSGRRIIYNTSISEVDIEKFISYGSGVARLNREAGGSPARSRHCNSERPGKRHCAKGMGRRREVMNWSQENCLIDDRCLTRERRGRNLRRLCFLAFVFVGKDSFPVCGKELFCVYPAAVLLPIAAALIGSGFIGGIGTASFAR